MRRMRGSGGEIHEKWFAGLGRLLRADPVDCTVRHIGQQVVTGLSGRRNSPGVLDQIRRPLIRVAADESVKVFKAQICGPTIEGPGRTDFPIRRVVPFSERGRVVPVRFEDLWDQGRVVGNDP